MYNEGVKNWIGTIGISQKSPPTMDVRGGFKKRMKVHFVISLILGDRESSDKICHLKRMPSDFTGTV
jgi:hypothetical protein